MTRKFKYSISSTAGVMTNSPAELVGMHVQSYIDSSRPSGILVSVHNKVLSWSAGATCQALRMRVVTGFAGFVRHP